MNDYLEKDFSFLNLRSKDDLEIDLIIQRPALAEVLVEIKSTEHIDSSNLRHLRALAPDFPKADKIVLCRESMARQIGDIRVLPWREGLQEIYSL